MCYYFIEFTQDYNLEKPLQYLSSLIEQSYLDNNTQQPYWYIKKENHFQKKDQNYFVEGSLNFGLSHGIIGVAHTLSLAYQKKMVDENTKKDILHLMNIYNRFSVIENDCKYWPAVLPYEKYIRNETVNDNKRMSWCYGSIGISNAKYQIGKNIHDKTLVCEAIEEITLITELPILTYGLTSSIVCHGISSVILLLNAMYRREPRLANVKNKIKELKHVLYEQYRPDSAFGFINFEQEYIEDDKIIELKIENNSLINGTSGIVLTLLSTCIDCNEFEKAFFII